MFPLPFSSLLTNFRSFLHGVNSPSPSSQDNLLEGYFVIVAGSEEVKQINREVARSDRDSEAETSKEV